MFLLHREGIDLPKMKFLMHNSGLNYYEHTNKYLVFLNTVPKNKEVFSKRKTNSAVKSRELQQTLGFPTAN